MPGLNTTPSENCELEYRVPGGNWIKVPGVGSFTESGGEAPTREVVAFEGAVTEVGVSRPPTVECAIPVFNPQHTSFRELRGYRISRTSLEFRFITKPELLYSSDPVTLAVAVTGVGTIAAVTTANPDPFKSGTKPRDENDLPGALVRIGATDLILFFISSSGVPNFRRADNGNIPSAAIVASIFEIYKPSLVRQFVGKVALSDRATMSAESRLESTLRLQPNGELPDWFASYTLPTGRQLA